MANVVPLSWETKPQRKTWTEQLLSVTSLHLATLETANAEQFVAGYDGLSTDGKVRYWAELVVAIAKFESNWKPDVVFHEPPPLGVDSVGLPQLSYEDELRCKVRSTG